MVEYTAVIVEDDATTRYLIEELLSQSGRFHTISSHSSAIDALNDPTTNTADILFLDVEMPGISGLELAKRIESDVKIVITTSESKYAIDAFGVKAFDFILKPVDITKLLDISSRLDKEKSTNSDKAIFLKTKEGFIRLDLNEVLAISAEGDYVFYHTSSKKYIARQSMTKALETCQGHSFIQVHRSHIVNLDQVSSFQADVIVAGELEIPLSRGFKDDFLSSINKVV